MKYRIDKNVLVFNLFKNKLRDYILLAVTPVIIIYVIPFIYYLIRYGKSSALFNSFKNDNFYISICLILFPLHAIIIKNLWVRISKLIKIGINQNDDFGISNSKIQKFKKEIAGRYEKILPLIVIPIASIFLSFLFLNKRESVFWWANNSVEYFGKILFLISLSFIFYQLINHNILGIKAIRMINTFRKLKPQINFWQAHNDYFFIGFQNIFINIVISSIIHVLSIISLYYFEYFGSNFNLPFLIFFVIFLIFGPMFWFYPLFIVHKILNRQKVKILDQLSSQIGSMSGIDKIQLISEYEIISNRKTWLISLPLKLFTALFIILQIVGIIFSIWAINQ